jgi:hypothetical protein
MSETILVLVVGLLGAEREQSPYSGYIARTHVRQMLEPTNKEIT